MRTSTDCAVIEFPRDRVRPASAPAAEPAEVLIFSGVRIERLHDLCELLAPGRALPASAAPGS